MLLQITCDPKLIASVNLSFDDGTTKSVDIRKGMFASFKYTSQGVSTEFSGVVSNVFLAPMEFKCVGPEEPPKHLGYICDPNYVNSGFLDTRHHPVPPMPHHHHHDMHDVRNFIEVIGAGKYAGQTKRIDIFAITDINVLYEDSKPVMTPDTFERVALIRVDSGSFQYSIDGQEWIDVCKQNEELETKLSNAETRIEELGAVVDGLIAKVKALEEAKE